MLLAATLLISLRPCLMVGVLMCASGATADLTAGEAPAMRDLDRVVRPLLQTHCTECHGGKDPDAGLSLQTLSTRFDEPASAIHWMHVHDQLIAGEMPPASVKQDRPTAAETAPVIAWLRTQLHAASLTRQRSEGRAAIRRLNRVEYENTVSDLLGIPVHVRDLLPEDGAVSGFDTVSGGLDISATHLVRYQQAAERALDAALPTAPPYPLKEIVSGKQWFERVHPNIRSFAGRSYTCEGDVGVLYQYDVHTDTDVRSQQRPMAPGLYRVRLTAAARNTQGRPLPIRLVWEDVRADSRLGHLIGYRDVPAGAPTTIDLVVDVPVERTRHSNILLQAFTLPPVPRNQDQDQTPPDPARSPALEIHRYELEGPLAGWPSPAYRTLFGDLPCEPRSFAEARAAGSALAKDPWTTWKSERFIKDPLVPYTVDARADAERLIRAFLPRAFRRPVDSSTADYYVAFAQTRLSRGIAFVETMRATYRAILCSPHFIFLLNRPGALDDHALASRLSYFLWSSQPDDALRTVADAGRLRQAHVLRDQVERMLADDKATRFIERFTDQWLGVHNALAMKPDDVYIEYDDHLGAALAPETRLFIREMLVRDLSVTALIDSDWTFLNQRLAKHYGIPDVHGYEFRKVALKPEHQRGGVLTHASILKATTNGTYTSPIKRGVWLLEQIVGKPPRPPPPDVAAVQPDIRGATTLREQIEKHRALPECAGCHAHIDPPGFALESYDVLGGFRTRYRTPGPGKGVKGYLETLTNYPDLKKVWFVAQVDPAAVTARGDLFTDLPAYKRILLQDPDQLARTVARKLMTYATGSDVQFADRQVLDALVAATKAKAHGLRTIVHALVQSRVFLEQ